MSSLNASDSFALELPAQEPQVPPQGRYALPADRRSGNDQTNGTADPRQSASLTILCARLLRCVLCLRHCYARAGRPGLPHETIRRRQRSTPRRGMTYTQYKIDFARCVGSTIQLKGRSGDRCLTDFDQISVRIAHVTANFRFVNFRFCDETCSARTPELIASLDVNDAKINERA